MAEKHWREFRPNMVQQMEATGELLERLYEAQEKTKDEMADLTEKLIRRTTHRTRLIGRRGKW